MESMKTKNILILLCILTLNALSTVFAKAPERPHARTIIQQILRDKIPADLFDAIVDGKNGLEVIARHGLDKDILRNIRKFGNKIEFNLTKEMMDSLGMQNLTQTDELEDIIGTIVLNKDKNKKEQTLIISQKSKRGVFQSGSATTFDLKGNIKYKTVCSDVLVGSAGCFGLNKKICAVANKIIDDDTMKKCIEQDKLVRDLADNIDTSSKIYTSNVDSIKTGLKSGLSRSKQKSIKFIKFKQGSQYKSPRWWLSQYLFDHGFNGLKKECEHF